MAGQIKVNQLQLGDSLTATQNFVWQTNVDGTAKLARGNVGATTQDILTVDAAGAVTMATGQLKFPAVQNPSADVNTLDDYEEGTWTPTFALATPGTSSFTYIQQQGYYTKIGRVVHLTLHVQTSAGSAGTGSGQFYIGGIPAALQSSPEASYHAGQIAYAAGFVSRQCNALMLQGSTTVLALCNVPATTAASGLLTVAEVGGAMELYGSISYRTVA